MFSSEQFDDLIFYLSKFDLPRTVDLCHQPLFDYIIMNYEKYPKLSEIAIYYCSPSLLEEYVKSNGKLLIDNLDLVSTYPNTLKILSLILSNPKQYELRVGERLLGRIGFQYFANPKANSGTVVDGLGTDMTVQTDEVNGTVSDAVEVDSESGDISVDITTPRNIFVDGKNFVVKMYSGI